MTRLSLLAILIALAAPAQAQPAGKFDPVPKLKPAVTVAGGVVRIGDLFEHAGRFADIAVFRAPDLGQTGSVPTGEVVAAVRKHDLFLFDTAGITVVTVSHKSRVIDAKKIKTRIAEALAGRHGLGAAKNLIVSSDRPLRSLQVEAAAKGELRVTLISYDPRTTRFDAILDLPDSAMMRRAPLRVSGTVVETIEILLAARRVARGEILKASDIVRERRSRASLGADVVTNLEYAVGLALRHPLRAGAPLRRADLMKPEIVKRNDAVTLVYEAPGVLLSTRGKALEAGTMGDLVSVQNLQSRRTVYGTITGPGRVTVSAHAAHIAANRTARGAAHRTARAIHPAARAWRPADVKPTRTE